MSTTTTAAATTTVEMTTVAVALTAAEEITQQQQTSAAAETTTIEVQTITPFVTTQPTTDAVVDEITASAATRTAEAATASIDEEDLGNKPCYF